MDSIQRVAAKAARRQTQLQTPKAGVRGVDIELGRHLALCMAKWQVPGLTPMSKRSWAPCPSGVEPHVQAELGPMSMRSWAPCPSGVGPHVQAELSPTSKRSWAPRLMRLTVYTISCILRSGEYRGRPRVLPARVLHRIFIAETRT